MPKPLVQKISYQNPEFLFKNFCYDYGSILLHSQTNDRYSFIAIEPYITLKQKDGILYYNNQKIDVNVFLFLQDMLRQFKLEPIDNLPPFQGGVCGYLSYEVLHLIEDNIAFAQNDLNFDTLNLGFYDLLIGFDNQTKEAYIFSSGFSANNFNFDKRIAKSRIDYLLNKINSKSICNKTSLDIGKIASNFSKEQYIKNVNIIKEYILAGDLFEANFTQRFTAPIAGDKYYSLYEYLAKNNPAPFSAYLNFDNIIISASPERFIKVYENSITACPIKGTIKREANLSLDAKNKQKLLTSKKDLAENVMIVDLLRNDISKVCVPGTVKVPLLCKLYSFATVHHLISTITAKLDPKFNLIDLIKACFPGGSITGAPKIRSMQIISELEKVARGPYCGSALYFGFDGSFDSSILIRSFVINENTISFGAGGAITLHSSPIAEYNESLIKAKALINCLKEQKYSGEF